MSGMLQIIIHSRTIPLKFKKNIQTSVFLLLIAYSLPISAQNNLCNQNDMTARGNFVVAPAEICAGESVTFSNLNLDAQNIQYYIGYNGQPQAELGTLPSTKLSTTTLSNTSDKDVTFTILQVATRNGITTYACANVLVKPSNRPDIATEACNANFLKITIPKNDKNTSMTYAIDWGDGTKEQLYSNPPIEAIRNYSTSNVNRTIAVRSTDITLKCAVPNRKTLDMTGNANHPSLQILELTENGAKASVELKGEPVEYQLYSRKMSENYKSGSNFFPLTPGIHSLPIDKKEPTCFMAYRSFACSVVSGEVCTVIQEDINIENDLINVVNWTVPTKNNPKDISMIDTRVTSYQITVMKWKEDGTLEAEFPLGEKATFEEVITDCSKAYCYQIKVEIQGLTSGSKRVPYRSVSYSEKKCAERSQEKLPAVDYLRTTVTEKQKVVLHWEVSPSVSEKLASFQIERIVGGTNERTKLEKETRIWEDELALPASQSYCYTLQYEDVCARKSAPTSPACTIHLQVNDLEELVWTTETPLIPQSSIVSQTVHYKDMNEIIQTEARVGLSVQEYKPALSQEDEMDEVIYFIEMVDNKGNTSRSNEVRIPLRLQAFVPEVFTPNLDGTNDELEIKGRRIKSVNSYVFEVYNRWGERVYSSNNPAKTWAGFDNNGKALPPSTYSYFLRLIRKDGEVIQKRGSISLVR